MRLLPQEGQFARQDSDGEEYEDETLQVPETPARFPAPGDRYLEWLASRSLVNLRGRSLQVIVKIADLRLDATKPFYDGSSWHVEGMLNENIVATGIYYYDASNVTASSPSTFGQEVSDDDSDDNDEYQSHQKKEKNGRKKNQTVSSLVHLCWYTIRAHQIDCSQLPEEVWKSKATLPECQTFLSFRSSCKEPEYPQGDDRGTEEVYGLVNEGPLCQDKGHVSTPPGRALCFPNILQHRVDDFEIIAPAPGYRRILVFWLCDPSHRLLSSSQVPPAQAHWFPSPSPRFAYSLEEAKLIRRILMHERKFLLKQHTKTIVQRTFSLCEH
jgi:hypothetical protein